jgi:hypothetical protein
MLVVSRSAQSTMSAMSTFIAVTPNAAPTSGSRTLTIAAASSATGSASASRPPMTARYAGRAHSRPRSAARRHPVASASATHSNA